MRGRPRKKPAIEAARIAELRQDLALRTLWIPLQQAAEQAAHVVQHGARGYAPMFDARFDRRGAAFMGVHTRMIAAPEERELSVGFPHAWMAVLKARYRTLEEKDVDATALLLLRLMCEASVQLLDVIMCALGAELVVSSGCCVYEAVRRLYFLVERVLATGIGNPAYDLGEMALWVWGQRYVAETCRFELAIYHELGIPYVCKSPEDFHGHPYYCPLHIWPPSGDHVARTELVAEWGNGGVPTFVLQSMSDMRAQLHMRAGAGLVYYSILEHLYDTAQFAAFGRVARVCKDFAALARWIVKKRVALQHTVAQNHNMLSTAQSFAFGERGAHRRQLRFIMAANAAQSLLNQRFTY